MVCQHRDLVTFCSSQMFYLVKFATSHERQTKLFLFHVEIITKLHIAKPHRRLYHVAGNLALFAKRLDVGFARLIERIPSWLRCWHQRQSEADLKLETNRGIFWRLAVESVGRQSEWKRWEKNRLLIFACYLSRLDGSDESSVWMGSLIVNKTETFFFFFWVTILSGFL